MISSALTEHLSSALPLFPAEGIAYRGDALNNAAGSLQRASANYIVFSPTAGSDVERQAVELQEGVSFALQFAYPAVWGENPRNPIPGAFAGYGDHYAQYPDTLPTISWGTASHIGQLATAVRRGRCFYTTNAVVVAGSVQDEGPITAETTGPVVVATLEDIQSLEAATVPPYGEEVVGMSVFRKLVRQKKRQPSRIDYLKGPGRANFHARLTELMTHRLLDSVAVEATR